MKKKTSVKHDGGKAQLSIIPKVALEYEAQALMYGANKYGRDNYKLGMEYTRLLDATLRHIYAFREKEDDDPESSLSHLGHARANLAMLIYYVENEIGTDDR